MKQDSSEETPQRIKEVYQWASLLAVENRTGNWLEYYYWTEPARRLLLRLRNLKRGLVGLIGLQGTGKTSALIAIRRELESEGSKVWYWRWMTEISWKHLIEYIKGNRYIFIDLPDYPAGSSRSISKHLDEIGKLWYYFRNEDTVFVVSTQKELLKDHYLIGKMIIIELPPLKPQQLIEAYKMRFETTEPFAEEALHLLAEMSRGVFRRFLRYIQLCLEETLITGETSIEVDLVKKTITIEQLTKDMELELNQILKQKEKKTQAVKILNLLREKGELNQKTIAKQINLHENTLAKLLDILETNNYIKRRRGTKKEILVQLT